MIDKDRTDLQQLKYSIIFQSFKNNIIKVIISHLIENNKMVTEQREETEYCLEIIKVIKKYCVFAVSDTLVKW